MQDFHSKARAAKELEKHSSICSINPFKMWLQLQTNPDSSMAKFAGSTTPTQIQDTKLGKAGLEWPVFI